MSLTNIEFDDVPDYVPIHYSEILIPPDYEAMQRRIVHDQQWMDENSSNPLGDMDIVHRNIQQHFWIKQITFYYDNYGIIEHFSEPLFSSLEHIEDEVCLQLLERALSLSFVRSESIGGAIIEKANYGLPCTIFRIHRKLHKLHHKIVNKMRSRNIYVIA